MKYVCACVRFYLAALLPLVAEASKLSSRRAPSVYVYDLPFKFKNAHIQDATCLDGSTMPSMLIDANQEPMQKCIFGQEVVVPSVRPGGTSLKFRDVDQFALGTIFHSRFLQYSKRTLSPSEADLFFVPVYAAHAWLEEWKSQPTADEVMSMLPWLSPETAKRHIILSPRVWLPKSYNDSLLALTTKLALETPLIHDGPGHEDPRFDSVPYPSWGSGLAPVAFQHLQQSVYDHRSDVSLASIAAGIHPVMSGGVSDLREDLMKMCSAQANCTALRLVDNGKGLEDSLHATVRMFSQSRFCLQPPGDSPSRKSIIDSMMMGCIPVLFSRRQLLLWPDHVKDWHAVSILFDTSEQNISGLWSFLDGVSEEKIADLKRNIRDVAKQLTYHPEPDLVDSPSHADAFDISLFAAWDRIRATLHERTQPLRDGTLSGTRDVVPSASSSTATVPSRSFQDRLRGNSGQTPG